MAAVADAFVTRTIFPDREAAPRPEYRFPPIGPSDNHVTPLMAVGSRLERLLQDSESCVLSIERTDQFLILSLSTTPSLF